eukprot:g45806.t1
MLRRWSKQRNAVSDGNSDQPVATAAAAGRSRERNGGPGAGKVVRVGGERGVQRRVAGRSNEELWREYTLLLSISDFPMASLCSILNVTVCTFVIFQCTISNREIPTREIWSTVRFHILFYYTITRGFINTIIHIINIKRMLLGGVNTLNKKILTTSRRYDEWEE